MNSALLSRCRVFVLKRLNEEEIESILTRALYQWRENADISAEESKSIKQLAAYSDGDGKVRLYTNLFYINYILSSKCIKYT